MNHIQQLEFDILKRIIKEFDQNGIDYFLCGGSMLGAIRHKGFIPWDDDIDIGMTRINYNKFLDFAKEHNYMLDDRYKLAAGELGNAAYPFAKVEDTHYELVKRHSAADKYLFIDIFPFDGLPEDDNENKKIFKKSKSLKKLICYKNIDIDYMKRRNKNPIKKFLELLGYYSFMKFISMDSLLKKDEKLTSKYSDDSKYAGCIVWGYGPGERVLRTDLETDLFEFEGTNVKGIKGYDNYLKGLYGNYMEIPSKDKIYCHETEIKKVK